MSVIATSSAGEGESGSLRLPSWHFDTRTGNDRFSAAPEFNLAVELHVTSDSNWTSRLAVALPTKAGLPSGGEPPTAKQSARRWMVKTTIGQTKVRLDNSRRPQNNPFIGVACVDTNADGKITAGDALDVNNEYRERRYRRIRQAASFRL